jgi:LysR family carnitine catabolism transcriptional activator
MNLVQLRYVLAVAEQGTFTRAASELGVAQPSLSQGVRSLEAELGAELFHRTSTGAVPTPAGEALLGPARAALRSADAGQAAVSAVRGLEAGTLDLVVLPSLAVEPSVDLVGRFRRAHPGVKVRVREPADIAAADDAIRSGASEVAITELHPGQAGLTAIELRVQELVALVPRAIAGGPGATVTLAALAASPIVTTPRGTSTRQQLDDSLATAGLRADIAVETDHREQIGPLVVAGAGVAILPRAVAEAIASPEVGVRPVVPRISRRIGLVHRDAPLTPAADAFVALARGTEPPQPRRPPVRRRRAS